MEFKLDIKGVVRKVVDVAKRVWDWADDRPMNFIIFAAACYLAVLLWEPLMTAFFWYLVTPGSFALTYGVWRWWKKRQG